jgi:hypothetical protein
VVGPAGAGQTLPELSFEQLAARGKESFEKTLLRDHIVR